MAYTQSATGYATDKATEISEGIYRVGVNIEDPDYLFEGLWPIPDGTSINGYAVKGEKKAIIDLTQIIFDFPDRYTKQLAEIGFALADVDYVIVNHLEPDHAGFLPVMAERNSKAKFYCTPKAVPGIQAFASIPLERIVEVKDGDTLDLGGGKVLQFFHAPNVHWPETMVTFEQSSGVCLVVMRLALMAALMKFLTTKSLTASRSGISVKQSATMPILWQNFPAL